MLQSINGQISSHKDELKECEETGQGEFAEDEKLLEIIRKFTKLVNSQITEGKTDRILDDRM